MQKFLRGQVWWCKCAYDVNSNEREYDIEDKQKLFNHIQQGMRPVLIVSNDTGNKYSDILQVVPCTSAEKITLPTHCSLYINKIKNTFLCEQTRTVNKSDMTTYMITLDEKEMAKIEECISISLGLKKVAKYEHINLEVENSKKTAIINKKEKENGK